MNINKVSICKKYATVFYEKFYNKIDLDQVKKIKELIDFLNSNKSFLFFLQLAFIDKDVKKNLIDKMFKKFEIIEDFYNLIMFLDLEQRIAWLPVVFDQLVEIYNLKNNIIEFNIVSAQELDNTDLSRIKNFLLDNTDKNIIYKISLDKSLIAGIKIYSKTLGWEHSIKKQILTLKHLYKENL